MDTGDCYRGTKIGRSHPWPGPRGKKDWSPWKQTDSKQNNPIVGNSLIGAYHSPPPPFAFNNHLFLFPFLHPSPSPTVLSFFPHKYTTMAADIGTIAQLLDATLDPSQHRKGTVAPRCSSLLLVAPPSRLSCRR